MYRYLVTAAVVPFPIIQYSSFIAQISPFSRVHPLSTFDITCCFAQGYDFMAQAVGGLMHITGSADGPPQKVGVAITDVMTGVLSAGAM
jgi:hypothetical protein